MTLTLFLTICVLGCDVLIFFLFQWTLGERRRTRRRRGLKTRLASGLETDLVRISARQKQATSPGNVISYPARPKARISSFRVSRLPASELSVYRRKAAAFASPRANAKLAV